MLSKFQTETQTAILRQLFDEVSISNKHVLFVGAGSGELLADVKRQSPASIAATESHPGLYNTASHDYDMIGYDLQQLNEAAIRKYTVIIINEPAERVAATIARAFEIASGLTTIVALCYPECYIEPANLQDRFVSQLMERYGHIDFYWLPEEESNGNLFGAVKLYKDTEPLPEMFTGFNNEEEAENLQEAGLVKYSVIREAVNRFNYALKLYDEQLSIAIKMEELLKGYSRTRTPMRIEPKNVFDERRRFKVEMQQDAWQNLFEKLELQKYSTRELKHDIEKFIHQQYKVTFTHANICRMLEIVIGTTSDRMNRALIEAFDFITRHHADNRINVEGWKTNSHYLVPKKFIVPGICNQEHSYNKSERLYISYRGNTECIEDLVKALCYLSGDKYDKVGNLQNWVSYRFKTVTESKTYFHSDMEGYGGHEAKKQELYAQGIPCTLVESYPKYGEWFEFAYWRMKGFKKGSLHCEFLDDDLWTRFNQVVAKLKGYPLYEGKNTVNSTKR